MTNEEILKKAIEKASKNGFLDGELLNKEWYVHGSGIADDSYILCIPDHEAKTKIHMAHFSVIFSHDFNKAFWGDNWMPRLQILVLEKDPIKYLEKFL